MQFFHTVLTRTLKCAILYMGGEASRWKQFCIPLRDLRRFYVYIDVLRRWGVPPLRFLIQIMKGENEMKNTEAFATIRRLLLILIAFSLCLSFVGCQLAETPPAEDPKEEEEGLSSNLNRGASGLYPHYCAYSSDEREFDIDNVTLTVYYGLDPSYQSLEEYRDETASYSFLILLL